MPENSLSLVVQWRIGGRRNSTARTACLLNLLQKKQQYCDQHMCKCLRTALVWSSTGVSGGGAIPLHLLKLLNQLNLLNNNCNSSSNNNNDSSLTYRRTRYVLENSLVWSPNVVLRGGRYPTAPTVPLLTLLNKTAVEKGGQQK